MQLSRDTRAVLFDFDGTLVRSLPHWTRAYQLALQAEGIALGTDDVIAACFRRDQTEVVREHRIPCERTFKERVWSLVTELMHEVDEFPRALDVLKRFREAQVKTALVTNSRRVTISPVIRKWETEPPLFDAHITIDDVAAGKPSPEPVERALEALKVPPRNAFMIGDNDIDILAGKRANVRTILFAPEENYPYFPDHVRRQWQPDHIACTYDEIEALVLAGN